MHKTALKLLKSTLLTATVCLTAPTFAADTTWNFRTNGGHANNQSTIQNTSHETINIGYVNGSRFGNTYTLNQGGNTLTISAWSDTNSSWNSQDKVESAKLQSNSLGLLNYNRNRYRGGCCNPSDGHAVDNQDNFDMLLFSFTNAVSLSKVNIGWAQPDSDMTIAAFTSAPALAGQTWAQVAQNALFKNLYADRGAGSQNVNTGNVEAKYWLIGAYNSYFGTRHGVAAGNDHLKIASITTHPGTVTPPPSAVSEPGTLALMGSILLLAAYRRRKA